MLARYGLVTDRASLRPVCRRFQFFIPKSRAGRDSLDKRLLVMTGFGVIRTPLCLKHSDPRDLAIASCLCTHSVRSLASSHAACSLAKPNRGAPPSALLSSSSTQADSGLGRPEWSTVLFGLARCSVVRNQASRLAMSASALVGTTCGPGMTVLALGMDWLRRASWFRQHDQR